MVIGSGFSKLPILWNCTTVLGRGCVRNLSWGLWASLSVNLALASCAELRPVCEFFVADYTCSLCSPLSCIDTFLSTAVAKWYTAASRKLCWINLSYWLPDTLQMFTHKQQINYYFCMLLIHMKMCRMFKNWLALIITVRYLCFQLIIQKHSQTTDI